MAFHPRAAVAAGIATICILTGTISLTQGAKPHARYVAAAAPAAAG